MLAIDNIEVAVTKTYDYLHAAMVQELVSQGHRNTGKLMDSIKSTISKDVDWIQLDCSFTFYGKFVDSGRQPHARKVPIDALIEWMNQKGFEGDAKQIKGMAFAIQKSIFDKGISTPQSWRGRETRDWMTKTLNENEKKTTDMVIHGVEQAFHAAVKGMLYDIDQRKQMDSTWVQYFEEN